MEKCRQQRDLWVYVYEHQFAAVHLFTQSNVQITHLTHIYRLIILFFLELLYG